MPSKNGKAKNGASAAHNGANGRGPKRKTERIGVG